MGRRNLRENILDAALQIFSRRGYAAASLREIIESIGVSKGGFYHHFATKEILFVGVVERILSGLNEGIVQSADSDRSFEERLRFLFVSPLLRNEGYLGLLVDGVRSSEYVRTRVGEMLRDVLRRCERLLQEGQQLGLVRDMIDCGAWAVQIVSTMEGAFLLASLGGMSNLRESLNRMYEQTWRSIKALSM